MEIKDLYYIIFNEMPVLIKTMSYNSPLYKELMIKAIVTKKQINEEDIKQYIDKNKIVYDTEL